MSPDNRFYDLKGRPLIGLKNTHDIDTAQHFLADHAVELIVAFDHHAMDPDVFIYVETLEGKLSSGDFYLWPLLHKTSKCIEAELAEMRRKDQGSWSWHYYERGLGKWSSVCPGFTHSYGSESPLFMPFANGTCKAGDRMPWLYSTQTGTWQA